MIKTTGNIAASANIVKESVVMGDVSIGADSTILFMRYCVGMTIKLSSEKGQTFRITARFTLPKSTRPWWVIM